MAARPSAPEVLPRVSAALTLLIAPVVLEPVAVHGGHGYTLVLVVTVALAALLAAGLLWRRGDVAAHAAAAGLAVLVLAGQLISATVGDPTGAAARWSPAGALLAMLTCLVLASIGLGLRGRARPATDQARRPYAL